MFSFQFFLIFFNVCFRLGDGDFGYFPHHLDLVLATSNALRYIHLKAGWWVGATHGERNDDAQSNQDDGDRVDDDSFLDHSSVRFLTEIAQSIGKPFRNWTLMILITPNREESSQLSRLLPLQSPTWRWQHLSWRESEPSLSGTCGWHFHNTTRWESCAGHESG